MKKPTRPPPYDVAVAAPFTVIRQDGDEGEWYIEGHASIREFSGDGVLIEPTALAEAIPEYMDNPLITASHDMTVDRIIGRAVNVAMDEVGLFVKALISKSERSLWTKIQEQIVRHFSIHALIRDAEWDEELGVARAHKIKLVEVAIVGQPADPGASFAIARESPFAVGREGIREMLNPIQPVKATQPAKDVGTVEAGDVPIEEAMLLLLQSTAASTEVARTLVCASVPGLVRADSSPSKRGEGDE